jgi:sigma-B regulation protein RsbU (phosphoserine phosphatase)
MAVKNINKSATKFKRGLAFRINSYIITSTIVIFGIILGYNYFISRKVLVENNIENVSNLTNSTIHEIESVLLPAQKIPENMAYVLEHSQFTDQELKSYLKSSVEMNKEMFGGTIAYEPHQFNKKMLYYAPYYFRNGDSIKYSDLGKEDYNYLKKDWYTIPKKKNQPLWSEPYLDKGGGNIVMTTYSVPFYSDSCVQKKLKGIVTIDLSLDWLEKLISSIKIYKTGYAFLISKKGTVIAHPDKEQYVMRQTIFEVANKTHYSLGQSMVQGKTGFEPYESSYLNKRCWVYYAPIKLSNWSIGIVIPEDELFADLTELTIKLLVIGIIGFIIITIIINLISRTISRPIRSLAKATLKTGSGEFDVQLPMVKTRDEIGQLTNSFSLMQDQLKTYIRNLQETTAAKERMENELRIASTIQMGMIPKEFPAFPNNNEFNIYGIMHPAKEVGGDLYNYFFVDSHHLCFTIGDVSGKGIPAALFMAMTNTLIKANALNGKDPAVILKDTNKELCKENDQMMFVTLFLGILNIHTGEVLFANAGHNPPMILRKNELPKFMKLASGVALGVFEDGIFTTEKLLLAPSETIYSYTDGVTEAANKDYKLYTETRLQSLMEKISTQNLDSMVSSTLADIHTFVDGAEQSDDITILTLRYN